MTLKTKEILLTLYEIAHCREILIQETERLLEKGYSSEALVVVESSRLLGEASNTLKNNIES